MKRKTKPELQTSKKFGSMPKGTSEGYASAMLPGCMRETAHDALMERVDEHGNVLGFSILGVSRFRKERPFEAELTSGQ
jgi:hypothetical protein